MGPTCSSSGPCPLPPLRTGLAKHSTPASIMLLLFSLSLSLSLSLGATHLQLQRPLPPLHLLQLRPQPRHLAPRVAHRPRVQRPALRGASAAQRSAA